MKLENGTLLLSHRM